MKHVFKYTGELRLTNDRDDDIGLRCYFNNIDGLKHSIKFVSKPKHLRETINKHNASPNHQWKICSETPEKTSFILSIKNSVVFPNKYLIAYKERKKR